MNIQKQKNLFELELNEKKIKSKYSNKIETPIYEPKNRKPHLMELVDFSKTKQLIKEINESSLSKEEKEFLIHATKRHIIFHYEKIADYYAHASIEMQNLMEKSGLVIIDFKKAIQFGFIKLTDELKKQYLDEYGE